MERIRPQDLGQLRQLQQWLRWVITDSRGVEDALADPHGGREAEPERRLGDLVEAAPLSRMQRLDVYAEAFYARLLEYLEQDFPALKRVLGEELFCGLVAGYLDAHPSRSYTAATLGARLADYLESYELTSELPYLPGLARLEWALVEAFFAPELPPIEPAALARLAGLTEKQWAKVRFELDPPVRLLRSDWNLDDLVEDEKEPAQLSARRLLVYRRSLKIKVERLEPAPFEVLEQIREGWALGEICAHLEARVEKDAAPPPLMDWFQGWIEAGVVRVRAPGKARRASRDGARVAGKE